jgi:hypothetical protein
MLAHHANIPVLFFRLPFHLHLSPDAYKQHLIGATPFPLHLALFVFTLTCASAQSPGSFTDGGNTQVSAMMVCPLRAIMLCLNVYDTFLDVFGQRTESVHPEGNAMAIPPGALSSQLITTFPLFSAYRCPPQGCQHSTSDADGFRDQHFCASGMHLRNGSFATFGGNGAVGPDGRIGSQPNLGNV